MGSAFAEVAHICLPLSEQNQAVYFSQIPGKSDIKQLLQQSVKQDKVPHATLIVGEAGRGGMPLVRALISSILCQERNPETGESCGQCDNCKKTHNLSHPDLHFTIPVIGAGARSADAMKQWREMMLDSPFASLSDWQSYLQAENKQFNINVLEINEIIEFTGMKSYQGQEKFLVIWMAEYLQKDGNRLLKIIEEPPPGMYIILLTEQREAILNTIQSRCRTLFTDPLSDEEIKNYLISEHQIAEEKAQSLAFQANGNLNTAISALQQSDDVGFQTFVEWMRACYTCSPDDIVSRADAFAKMGREAQKQLLSVGLNTLEAILTSQYLGADELRLPVDQQKPIRSLAKLLNLHQIQLTVNLLQEASESIQQNANAKILYTHFSREIHEVFHNPQ